MERCSAGGGEFLPFGDAAGVRLSRPGRGWTATVAGLEQCVPEVVSAILSRPWNGPSSSPETKLLPPAQRGPE